MFGVTKLASIGKQAKAHAFKPFGGNPSFGQRDITKDKALGNWPLQARAPLHRGMSPRQDKTYAANEQFWGRAVRASRDFTESGTLFNLTATSLSCTRSLGGSSLTGRDKSLKNRGRRQKTTQRVQSKPKVPVVPLADDQQTTCTTDRVQSPQSSQFPRYS